MFRGSKFATQPALAGLPLACLLLAVPAQAEQSLVQGNLRPTVPFRSSMTANKGC